MTWTDVPKTFGLCQRDDCPLAATCLRHVCETLLPERHWQWSYVTRAATSGYLSSACQAFVSAQPVRVALGFTRALGQVKSAQLPLVRQELIHIFGKSTKVYYLARWGGRPLSDEEQRRVEEVFVRYGVEAPVTFDAYEERILFPD